MCAVQVSFAPGRDCLSLSLAQMSTVAQVKQTPGKAALGQLHTAGLGPNWTLHTHRLFIEHADVLYSLANVRTCHFAGMYDFSHPARPGRVFY